MVVFVDIVFVKNEMLTNEFLRELVHIIIIRILDFLKCLRSKLVHERVFLVGEVTKDGIEKI